MSLGPIACLSVASEKQIQLLSVVARESLPGYSISGGIATMQGKAAAGGGTLHWPAATDLLARSLFGTRASTHRFLARSRPEKSTCASSRVQNGTMSTTLSTLLSTGAVKRRCADIFLSGVIWRIQ